jgi:hypothetical protein
LFLLLLRILIVVIIGNDLVAKIGNNAPGGISF